MKSYLATILKEEYISNPLDVFYRKDDKFCFVSRCEKVRISYRNPAAHSNVLSKKDAELCYRAVVGKREAEEHLLDISGIILQMYRFLKE